MINLPDEGPYKDAKFDDATDSAVVKYAEDIREWIYDSDGSHIGKVSLDEDFALSTDHTLISRQFTVRSDFGTVIVLPNFVKKSAVAAILNVGLIRAMHAEGYTAEYIQQNGKIYGDLRPHTKENIELFGYYLTHKI